jgi:hypothetical protein
MNKPAEIEEAVNTLGIRGIIILALILVTAIPASIAAAFWIDGRYSHSDELKTLKESNTQLANAVIELKQTTNQLKVYLDILGEGKFKISAIADKPPENAFNVPQVAPHQQPALTPLQQKELEAFKASLLATQPVNVVPQVAPH